MKTLPPHLILDDTGLGACDHEGNGGSSVSIHAVYHVTILRLNRHTRHALLPNSLAAHNVQTAVTHVCN